MYPYLRASGNSLVTCTTNENLIIICLLGLYCATMACRSLFPWPTSVFFTLGYRSHHSPSKQIRLFAMLLAKLDLQHQFN